MSKLTAELTYAIGIPARFDSTRFPGKPLANLAGQPMITHVIKRALQTGLGRVIVATDHQGIAGVATQAGAEVAMTSPDHESGTARLAQAFVDIDVDIVINVQGDEPLIDPQAIRDVVVPFAHQAELQMATLAHPIRHANDFNDPNVVKVVCNAAGHAMYFSRSPLPYPRNSKALQDADKLQHVGLYAYRRDFLLQYSSLTPCKAEQAEQLEQLRVLHHGYPIAVTIGDYHCLGVDTPQDMQRAEALLLSA
ncbi:3-deoxy-manno-octulosonate cytidylyltransferase [Ghiorsea bivora]|uniref:3-deoxy-manno-octulosonate cytidylyltransferase n=1 Tax=Ghiorsea bivora TaxID=1485545 RepID=UPI00056F93BC|nr:3-deoxy-manno-octulosonate cytidylyltransferase [Ghiorsea bivora]